MSITKKLIISIITALVLVYLPSMGYLGIKNKQDFYQVGSDKIEIIAKQHALEIEEQFNKYFSVIRTLSNVNQSIVFIAKENRPKIILANYKTLLNENTDIDGIWDSWDFFQTDSNGVKIEKRVSYTAERSNNKITTKREIKEITEAYAKIRKKGVEYVMEPYLYSFSGKKADEVLVTSLTEKMFIDDKQVGLVGIDISLNSLQNILNKVENINQGKVELLSYQGQYLSAQNKNLIGKNAFEEGDTLLQKIKTGNAFSILTKNDSKEVFKTYMPIKLGNFQKHWILVISVPKEIIEQKANDNFILTMIIGLIGIIILSIAISFITTPMISPIRKITILLKQLSKGDIENIDKVKYKSKNEIGTMATALNNMIDDIKDKAEFAAEIGNNNFNAKLKNLNEKDSLGNALINMRDNLKSAEEVENERKLDEEKRKWANKGEAIFGEILRTNNNNLAELNDIVLKNLVEYTSSNQGGIFLINNEDDNEEEKTLSLVSAYAYERKKFLEKDILLGEGLVGTCAIEGLSTYITDIPDNYINITSGLGSANPKSLLLVPLKTDTEIIGVIEIASFNEFDKYQIEFIEKLARTLASSIISVKVNEKTVLLLEQTQQQAEEMQAQEEEMRQNLEELQATQEEADRKANEMKSLIDSLKESNFLVEYDTDAKIIDINEKYLNLLNLKKKDVIGMHHKDHLVLTKEQEKTYEQFWADLKNGIPKKVVFNIDYNGKKYTFNENYIPIKDIFGEVTKIIKLANNINDFKEYN